MKIALKVKYLEQGAMQNKIGISSQTSSYLNKLTYGMEALCCVLDFKVFLRLHRVIYFNTPKYTIQIPFLALFSGMDD